MVSGVIAAGTVAVGVGCRLPDEVIARADPQLVVHAVLDPASADQLVLLEWARTGNDGTRPAFCDQSLPTAPVADVSIGTPEGVRMTAAEDTASRPLNCTSRLYRVTPGRFGVALRPGATYDLRVRTTAGGVVTGRTIIPRVVTPADSSPPEPFDRGRDTLRLAWTLTQDAASYEVRVDRFYSSSTLFTPGPSAALSGIMRDLDNEPLFVSGTRAIVSISAVDRNYYDYYRTSSDPFTSGSQANHLTGGVGVFGALVVIARRTLDVRGSPQP
ncbi:MAG: DUF4249 family protein [bacterium]